MRLKGGRSRDGAANTGRLHSSAGLTEVLAQASHRMTRTLTLDMAGFALRLRGRGGMGSAVVVPAQAFFVIYQV